MTVVARQNLSRRMRGTTPQKITLRRWRENCHNDALIPVPVLVTDPNPAVGHLAGLTTSRSATTRHMTRATPPRPSPSGNRRPTRGLSLSHPSEAMQATQRRFHGSSAPPPVGWLLAGRPQGYSARTPTSWPTQEPLGAEIPPVAALDGCRSLLGGMVKVRPGWDGEVLGQNSRLPVQRTLIYKISFSYGVRSKPCYLHRIILMESTLRTATFPCFRNELSLKDQFVTARR